MVDICTEGLSVLCFLGYHILVQYYTVKHSLLFIIFILILMNKFAPNLASGNTFELALYPKNRKGVERSGWEMGDLNFIPPVVEIPLGSQTTLSQGLHIRYLYYDS